jgi:hypothetical protein
MAFNLGCPWDLYDACKAHNDKLQKMLAIAKDALMSYGHPKCDRNEEAQEALKQIEELEKT